MALAGADQRPITPERVIHSLSNCLDDDAVVVADPGTPCPYVSAHYAGARQGAILSQTGLMALGFAWRHPWAHI